MTHLIEAQKEVIEKMKKQLKEANSTEKKQRKPFKDIFDDSYQTACIEVIKEQKDTKKALDLILDLDPLNIL